MGDVIDSKIVEMQFDNKKFEANAAQSISTIEKLNSKLDFDGVGKGLTKLDGAVKKLNFSPIEDAVSVVQARFSALEVVGVTALANIANSAVNTGKKMVSALTIDPIKTGFAEYETQIGAIQTILANTQHEGTNLGQVNAALDELNKYADQTIYNFTEMTRNIGTFTAAGVSLDSSVTSIKGIANLAAISGSTSAQASNAMYQLSQALAAGKVNLMDWNSVVNAGMGGKVFQDALKRTAEHFGYNVDAMIDKYGSFRESLSRGKWLTADVLTETLTQLSGAYTEADLIAQGYTQDQAKSIVELANTAVSAATEVKTFTQLWDVLKEAAQSGWSQTWRIIVGDFEEAKELFTGVSNALTDMINRSSNARNNMLEGWANLGGRESLINSFTNVFKALGSIIEPISDAFRKIFPPKTATQVYAITKSVESFTEKLILSEEAADQVQSVFEGVFSVVKFGIDLIKEAVKLAANVATSLAPVAGSILGTLSKIGTWVTEGLTFASVTDKISEKFEGFASIIEGASSTISKWLGECSDSFSEFGLFGGSVVSLISLIGKAFKGIAPTVASVGNLIASAFKKITEGMSLDNIGDAMGIFNSGIFATILLGIKKFISSADGIGSGFSGILDSLKGSLESFQKSIKAGTLIKIAVAMGILAVSLVALSAIDPERLKSAVAGMTVLFVELGAAMKAFQNMDFKKGFGSTSKMVAGMIAASFSILILSSAVKKLSSVDPEKLKTGLMGVGAILAGLSIFMNKTDLDGMGLRKGAGLLLFATSITILSSAIKKLGSMDSDAMKQGLGGMAGILVELSIFMNAISGVSKTLSKSVGLVVLASSMLIFASALEKFGSIPLDVISLGLRAMAGVLIEVWAALELIPKGTVAKSTGLVIFASALLILASALQQFGSMSLGEMGVALGTLAGALTEITIALNFMNGTLGGSAAILVFSVALAALVPSLLTLSGMSLGEILTALGTLAATLGVIAGAAFLLSPVIPIILALSGALALFGLACVSIGAGVFLLSAGLSALAVSGTAGAGALVLVVSSLLHLIPVALEQLGLGIVAFINTIAGSADAFIKAFETLILSMAQAISTTAPTVINTLLDLLSLLLSALNEKLPSLMDAGANLIISLLDGITRNMDGIASSATTLITTFLDNIGKNASKIVDAGFKMILDFMHGLADSIRENVPALMDAAIDIADAIIDGVVQGFKNGVGRAVDSVKQVGKDIIGGFKKFLGIHSPSRVSRDKVGKPVVQGIAEGITEDMSAEEAAEKKAKNIVDAFQKEFDKVDLRLNTSDLTYELWTKQNEYSATDAEKSAKELANINNQIMFQNEKAKLAQEEYQVTLDTFGEQSSETQEAYNKLLQEQIDLADLHNQYTELTKELTETQQSQVETNQAAFEKYAEFIQKNKDNLLALGVSLEEIKKVAAQRTGYNPNLDTQAMNNQVAGTVTNAMGTVEQVYSNTAQSTFGSLTSNFTQWGTMYADALGSGLQNGVSNVPAIVANITDACADALASKEEEFYNLGYRLGSKFTSGFKDALAHVLNKLQTEIDDDTFTITPVLDLSQVGTGVAKMSSMMSGASTGMEIAAKVREGFEAKKKSMSEGTSKNASGISKSIVNNFTQNNYSPKALSRLDIYRQTKNQLATVKKVVDEK